MPEAKPARYQDGWLRGDQALGPHLGLLRTLSTQRRIPAAIRNVAFPIARRGYEQRAVDAYVTRVNRLIAELEATRSPRDAVDHALARTEEERSAMLRDSRATAAEILAAAQEEAEQITSAARADAANMVVDASAQADGSKSEADAYVAKARAQADDIMAQARTDAAQQLEGAREEIANLRAEAQEWLQELRLDTERVWDERRRLVADLREIAARLEKAVAETDRRSTVP